MQQAVGFVTAQRFESRGEIRWNYLKQIYSACICNVLNRFVSRLLFHEAQKRRLWDREHFLRRAIKNPWLRVRRAVLLDKGSGSKFTIRAIINNVWLGVCIHIFWSNSWRFNTPIIYDFVLFCASKLNSAEPWMCSDKSLGIQRLYRSGSNPRWLLSIKKTDKPGLSKLPLDNGVEVHRNHICGEAIPQRCHRWWYANRGEAI